MDHWNGTGRQAASRAEPSTRAGNGAKCHDRLFRREAVLEKQKQFSDTSFPGRSGVQGGATPSPNTRPNKPNLRLIDRDGQVKKVRKFLLMFYRAGSHKELPIVIPITTRQAAPMPLVFLNHILIKRPPSYIVKQTRKAHRNGIKKPKSKGKSLSLKGVSAQAMGVPILEG
jgi:Ribosomal L29e protein family